MFGKNRKEKKRISKLFEKYDSPNIVDELLAKNDGKDYLRGTVNFVIFQVRDDTIESIHSLLEEPINISTRNGASIGDIISSFVSVFYRIDDVNKSKNQILAKQLANELKTDIKVIYGSKEGAIGNTGSKTRLSYGPIIPEMGNYMKTLTNLDYGDIAEV